MQYVTKGWNVTDHLGEKVTLTKLLYTEAEVAELTGIPRSTLKTSRSRPTKDSIPFTRRGRSVFYSAKELLRWIEKNTSK